MLLCRNQAAMTPTMDSRQTCLFRLVEIQQHMSTSGEIGTAGPHCTMSHSLVMLYTLDIRIHLRHRPVYAHPSLKIRLMMGLFLLWLLLKPINFLLNRTSLGLPFNINGLGFV